MSYIPGIDRMYSGLIMKYLYRGSGYYIDTGASELVARGVIQLKAGVEIDRLTDRDVVGGNPD